MSGHARNNRHLAPPCYPLHPTRIVTNCIPRVPHPQRQDERGLGSEATYQPSSRTVFSRMAYS